MATATLADSLLDDLDDLSDHEHEEASEENHNNNNDDVSILGKDDHDPNEDHADADLEENNGEASKDVSSAPKRKRLVDDEKLKAHLHAIQTFTKTSTSTETSDQTSGGEQTESQYQHQHQHQLMTSSNKFLIAVQTELTKAFEDLMKAYNPKFPELEDLLPNPIAYKNAIKVIQNEMDLTLVHDQLSTEAHLSANQIITLSVASSTTQGEPLTPTQLIHVNQCIKYMEQILHIQSTLTSFVESHMERLAPNTCILIGPTLAAKMVVIAGGLSELSRIPACNLQVLGQTKATSASRGGMSTSIAANANANTYNHNRMPKPHEGMLAECDLYRSVPGHLQRKALKVIAAKLALAIRCDYVHLERSGSSGGRVKSHASGMKFRKEIEKKFAKLIEPDVAPVIKALPKCTILVLMMR
jgi:U4/U6 small nuclear ribonucleoprotein PRP31